MKLLNFFIRSQNICHCIVTFCSIYRPFVSNHASERFVLFDKHSQSNNKRSNGTCLQRYQIVFAARSQTACYAVVYKYNIAQPVVAVYPMFLCMLTYMTRTVLLFCCQQSYTIGASKNVQCYERIVNKNKKINKSKTLVSPNNIARKSPQLIICIQHINF